MQHTHKVVLIHVDHKGLGWSPRDYTNRVGSQALSFTPPYPIPFSQRTMKRFVWPDNVMVVTLSAPIGAGKSATMDRLADRLDTTRGPIAIVKVFEPREEMEEYLSEFYLADRALVAERSARRDRIKTMSSLRGGLGIIREEGGVAGGFAATVADVQKFLVSEIAKEKKDMDRSVTSTNRHLAFEVQAFINSKQLDGVVKGVHAAQELMRKDVELAGVIVVTERSAWDSYRVFFPAAVDAGKTTTGQVETLANFSIHPNHFPDGIILLDTSEETCVRRQHARKMEESKHNNGVVKGGDDISSEYQCSIWRQYQTAAKRLRNATSNVASPLPPRAEDESKDGSKDGVVRPCGVADRTRTRIETFDDWEAVVPVERVSNEKEDGSVVACAATETILKAWFGSFLRA